MFNVQLIHQQKLGAFLVIAFMSLWFSSAYATNDKLNQLEVQAEAFQKGLSFAQKGSLEQALKVWEEL
ncbi:MAG TPA: hypothetical protein ENK73_02620, partial [Thiomicrospira sp.]|nr:hypothetical protein [Thiomicrospira sp.]